MKSKYQEGSFDRVKDAICNAFCISDLNYKWCILRKLTPETQGQYKLSDLLYKPKKENPLRRYLKR